jgi:cytochrome c
MCPFILWLGCFVFFISITASSTTSAGTLHDAAKVGDRAALESILTKDMDIDDPDGSGKSALYIAAEADHADIVTLLAAQGADPNRFITGLYSGQSAPIHAAIRKGNLKAIRALADAGADLTLPAYGAGAPLHIAIVRGKDQVAALLKSLGAAPFEAPRVDHLIPEVDIADGERAASLMCSPCHALKPGDTPVGAGYGKLGPSLWDIIGRQKAGVSGYEYSSALLEIGGTWTYADLNSLTANPTAYAPGTAMLTTGIAKPQFRAALIAYLRTLSENPVPLP